MRPVIFLGHIQQILLQEDEFNGQLVSRLYRPQRLEYCGRVIRRRGKARLLWGIDGIGRRDRLKLCCRKA